MSFLESFLCAGFGAASTAVAIATDMQNGVIDRFRSLPIASASVLVGHVVTSAITNLIATVIVFGVAFLTGFRTTASVLDWFGVFGVLLLFILALSWAATAFGLLLKNAEAAKRGDIHHALPALSQQCLRAHRHNATIAAINLRISALHPADRDNAEPAALHTNGQQRVAYFGLV
ncbi:MAG: ABC transporter permease [Thermomicrobiales bacterium]